MFQVFCQRFIIGIFSIFLLSTIAMAGELTVYPVFQNFSPLALTSCQHDVVKRVQLDFQHTGGVGLEYVLNPKQTSQFSFGMEYVKATSQYFNYQTNETSLKETKGNYYYEIYSYLARWRNFTPNKSWFFALEAGIPQIKTDHEDLNNIINFRTPFFLGLGVGVALADYVILDISGRRYLFSAETRYLENITILGVENLWYSSYEMNSMLISIKTYFDL